MAPANTMHVERSRRSYINRYANPKETSNEQRQLVEDKCRVPNFTLYFDFHRAILDNFYIQEGIILKY